MRNKSIYNLEAKTCKALAHPLRIEVIDVLRKRELCFTDILDITGGLKSNLSQHLSIMVENGLLKVRKDKRCNYFSLSSHHVAKACSLMREVLIDNLQKDQKLLKHLK